MNPVLGAALVAASLLCGRAEAAGITIGLAAGPTSMDPQFYVIGPNSSMARNVFDGLVNQGAKQQIEPALAERWTLDDDTHWTFHLRPGVRFHDGTSLTAADVVASLERVPLAARGSPSSYAAYVADILKVEALDEHAIRITTSSPAALLLNNLSRIAILPARAKAIATAEMNAGQGVVGTGPYRFVGWSPDGNVELARNDAYWGAAPAWDQVHYRVFANPSARMAALRAGDVDVVEQVPTADIAGLTAQGTLRVVSVTSNRVMYLHPDQDRAESPFAKGPDGSNPLQKAEVRRAISLALNRRALVDRIMDGHGTPAGQLVPDGFFGAVPALKPDAFDPRRAQALLAQAGYPQGFSMTFHATNDRYPNDSQVAQAIGQFLTRVGIRTTIETLPGSVYFTRASRREFSLIMGGAAVETGEASGVLGPLLETFGPSAGQGNRGRYTSPAFDHALQEARRTTDETRRRMLLEAAMSTAMADLGVIPLFFLDNTWALKAGLTMDGRTDGYTLAAEIRPHGGAR